MNRALAAESAVLLLLVSLLGRGWIPPASRGSAETQPTRTSQEPFARHDELSDRKEQPPGPWLALQSFLAGRSGSASGQVPDSDAARWSIPMETTRRAMVAIVPDPVRTHLALTFDRTLEAIQLAASKGGYDVDRYWLPWHLIAAHDGDASSPSIEPGEPGLLVFRAASPNRRPSLLLVLVVGETPTGGINGWQFRNALDDVDALQGSSAPAQDAVQVIGPSFSGSLASLRQLAGSRKMDVFSGSVSSLCAMAAQGLTEWPVDTCGVPDAPVPQSNLTFRSFVHPTELALSRFVLDQYPDPATQCVLPRIAVLSETATTFGTKVTESAEQRGKKPVKPWGRCVESITFPREIASLRNAAGMTDSQRSQPSPDSPPNQPLLPFNLTDPTNASDAPPDFSKQGPLSKEAVLMNIAAGLRRSRYRLIGIVGTNVLDTVFLADFLRRKNPDSRLFMIGADLLFERQVDNLPYLGTLALTSRSLVAEPPWQTPPSKDAPSLPPSLPFADDYEGGTYEAASSAIAEITNKAAADAYAYAGDADLGSADLWMTVVGAGGYWPVKLLVARPSGLAATITSETRLGSGEFSSAWRTLLVFMLAAALLHIGVVISAAPYAMRNRDFAPMRAAANQRMFFIHTSTAAIALGLFLFAAPAWRYSDDLPVLRSLAVIVLAGILACAVCLEGIYVLRWRWRRRDQARDDDAALRTLVTQLGWMLGVWTLVGALASMWWELLDHRQPDAYGYLFAYRAVHPTSGVSPLAPILPLLIAVYVWSLFEIWRLRFNGYTRARLSVSTNSAAPLERQRAEQAVASAVARPWLRMWHGVGFVLLFLIWLSFFQPFHPFVLFEADPFGLLYGSFFCAVVGLMLSSGLRMAQIWTSLRRLLTELERSRVRTTFARLKDKTWSFWRQGGEYADWMYVARSLEALQPLTGRNLACSPFAITDGPIVESIRQCQRSLDGITAHLGQDGYNALDPLPQVKSAIEHLRTAFRAGAYPTLLQTTLEGAASRLETCESLGGGYDARTMREAIQTVSGKLDMALTLCKLAAGAEATRTVVEAIRTQLEVFRGKPPAVAAFRSLVEYWRGTRDVNAAPRVSAAYAIENRIQALQETLAAVLEQAVPVLEKSWKGSAGDDAEGTADKAKQNAKDATPDDFQLDCLAEFVALRHVVFIRGVLAHLRHVMIFVALSFSLALISLNIYSFEPHQSLIWSFTAIFLFTGLLIVSVLAQLHRDPILSRMTGTDANALDWHFYLRVAAFGAVPLFTLLTTYFPSIGRQLVSFVGPSLDAFK